MQVCPAWLLDGLARGRWDDVSPTAGATLSTLIYEHAHDDEAASGVARRGPLRTARAACGASIATLVREAIDAAFPDDGPDRSEAVRRLLDAAPIQVSDWALMKDEIDQMYESTAG